jgi:hypothetical protein
MTAFMLCICLFADPSREEFGAIWLPPEPGGKKRVTMLLIESEDHQ